MTETATPTGGETPKKAAQKQAKEVAPKQTEDTAPDTPEQTTEDTPPEATPEGTENGQVEVEPETLLASLRMFQSSAPSLQRDKINPHFKSRYLSLESLMEQILPVLTASGLILVQQPGFEKTRGAEGEDILLPSLKTSLIHAGTGERIETTMLILAGRADPQGQGAAITYARRQATMAMLGLVADEDDDANRAMPRRGPSTGDRARPRGATPTPTPAADTPPPDAADAAAPSPNDPERTRTLIGVANQIIMDIQSEFGDHPEGMPWSKRMSQKVQEWFGHGLDEVTTAEATTLVQRLRATRTKLIEDRDRAATGS